MSLPDVCLAPYEAGEIPPDVPLCAPATHQKWVLGNWRLVRYNVREIVADDGVTRLVAQWDGKPNPPTFFWIYVVPASEKNVVNRALLKMFWRDRWERRFYFNANCQLIAENELWRFSLSINISGEMSWKMRSCQDVASDWFYPTDYKSLFHEGNEVVIRKVEEELSNSESSCSFFFAYCQMSQNEKFRQVCLIEQVTWREWENLIKDIIHNAGFIWITHHQVVAVVNFKTTEDIIQSVIKWVSASKAHQLQDYSSEFVRWSEVLDASFDFKWSDYKFLHNIKSVNTSQVITVGLPSAHERLEARLRLRDWLQGKVAPDEIPALLGEQ